jgi:glycosyltransferase involved in cell wall biosynthesis
MSDKNSPTWICCQLGAREHYAIPNALNLAGDLFCLITDFWIPRYSWLNSLPKFFLPNLRERFHQDLSQAPIYAFNDLCWRYELDQRLKNVSGWKLTIARNDWFQNQVIELLKNKISHPQFRPILFTYSYAALNILRFAKSQGWYTILGQIDPGLIEEKIVIDEHIKYPEYESNWQPAPAKYWQNWQEECMLADRIIVNSPWSSQALQQVGVPIDKIDISPLAYQVPLSAVHFKKTYPASFSFQRPLRVLFLGQVILRKGIAPLLEAAKILSQQPIDFWIVGTQGIIIPQQLNGRIKWIGSVPRSMTKQYYQAADVFLFPTISDGFGLTQLEAQAWKLPIITSRFCGEVINTNINGFILKEVSAAAIAEILLFCLDHPKYLAELSQSSVSNNFSLSQLHSHLVGNKYTSK